VGSEDRRTAISAAVFAIIVIALLVAGGLYVRGLISQSFDTESRLTNVRALTINALNYQIDEETGLRGYQATHQRVFLEPYFRGKPGFGPNLARLEAALPSLDLLDAKPAVDDLGVLNADYLREVAGPLSAPKPPGNALALETLGKRYVDRFRNDVRTIGVVVDRREVQAQADVRTSIDRIGLLVGAAIVLVLMISLLYGTSQAALAARAERERVRAAEQQHEADVLRAAYVTEKRIADTLQEAFVQRPLPTHPTFRFSATYVPASEETKVGGDWYDALELPGNRVLFAIGDVTGHGIEAAVTMNRVRQALISSALLDPMPAPLLTRVGRELYSSKAPLVTAVAGFADANTFEFVYASAGHPPPLLIEPGRPPRMLNFGSLPLGAMNDNEYQTHRVQSVPGAMLVLYTDGAIEHSHDVIEGERILLAAAADAARAVPPDPATFIHDTVFAGREIGDDVAILTIGFAVDPAVGVRVSADNAQTAFSGTIATRQSDPEQRFALRNLSRKVA
jgi:serine phosphatase RsbU (regulator of sigma subunit)